MNIVRVYSGDDGESHFQVVTLEEFAEIAKHKGSGDVQLNTRPSPSFSDYHTAPRRQYVVGLSGLSEFECADGTKYQMGTGDILVAEDMTGHGHIARGLGDQPRVLLAVPLSE